MAGITEIKKLLKRDFVARLEEQFSTFDLEKILRWFEKESFTTIRINTNKISIQEVMKILRENWALFERIPFLPYTLILKNRKEKFVEELEMYKNWTIYMQNVASQLPPYFLEPKKLENILDISAAPWSKTTQIAMITNDWAKIIANDIDEIRVERLKYNIKKQWFKNIETLNKNWAVLWWIYEWKMDKVLLDAPCSAEWRINLKKPKSYKFWAEKNISKNVKVQKQLFKSAFKSLKKGGILVYSTCTLAPEENEFILTWALEKYPELKLLKIFLPNFEKNLLPILDEFNWKTFNPECKKALKAVPGQYCEWFFIAKFLKK